MTGKDYAFLHCRLVTFHIDMKLLHGFPCAVSLSHVHFGDVWSVEMIIFLKNILYLKVYKNNLNSFL